jgi:two-component system sensor histidine kinase DegS
MSNARDHGQASRVQVLLDLAPDQVMVVLEDNGSGFNVDDVMGANGRDNIGLSTLRERIEMLGGQLNVESSLGHGSRVEFSIPTGAAGMVF